MNLRKIIREEISRVFQEDDTTGGLFGDTLNNIGDELQTDLDNVGTIIKTQQLDIQNMDNQIKSDSQLKSKLDANNAHRKGLEREIPERQKDYEVRKKQLKDLKDAQKGLQDAQQDIANQQNDLEKQSQQTGQSSSTNGTQTISVLPSLQSPI